MWIQSCESLLGQEVTLSLASWDWGAPSLSRVAGYLPSVPVGFRFGGKVAHFFEFPLIDINQISNSYYICSFYFTRFLKH